MPTYDYKCSKCRKKFSVIMSIAEYDQKKAKCPKCGSRQVEQVIQSFFAVTSKKS
ncbi:MAG: zinc ribbon domain-containing protein [Acidobacteria bacterium]|nr:zinc ribbon domain-containing protein [Acidobacteriota bacterium]